VKKDRVKAYMWFLLAKEQGDKRAKQGIEWIGPQMEASAIEKARRKAEKQHKETGSNGGQGRSRS
jgi:hypothetical protein